MKTENVNLLLYCCLLENIMLALYFDAHRVFTYREYIIRKDLWNMTVLILPQILQLTVVELHNSMGVRLFVLKIEEP